MRRVRQLARAEPRLGTGQITQRKEVNASGSLPLCNAVQRIAPFAFTSKEMATHKKLFGEFF